MSRPMFGSCGRIGASSAKISPRGCRSSMTASPRGEERAVREPNGEQGPQRPTQLADSVGPPFEISRLLQAEGFRHAFFTRQGGVSLPPFDSLNVAAASTGDSPANVAENVRLCA